MRIKVWLTTAFLVLGVYSVALAQEHKMENMSPQEKAAMDAMMKAMTPGDAHKLLAPMVGTFEAKVTMWSAPGAQPMVTTGTSVNKWVLGDRDIEQRFTSVVMGMPFYGIGYTGYDNVTKRYWGTWIDNMSTGLMTQYGTTADTGKSWKFTGTMADPMSGKETTTEMRVAIADADHHTMESWGPGPDGKMYKMMEITYARKK